jgi:hypothetical protein
VTDTIPGASYASTRITRGIAAVSGVADAQLNGGPGVDTAHYDGALDPVPLAVENHLPE